MNCQTVTQFFNKKSLSFGAPMMKMSSLTLPAAQPMCTKMINILNHSLYKNVADIGELQVEDQLQFLLSHHSFRHPRKILVGHFNQALGSQVDSAKRRALVLGSLAFCKRDSAIARIQGMSHDFDFFCRWEKGGCGGD